MKKIYMHYFVFSILLSFISLNLHSATITSTQNGRWNLTTTWVGGIVPKSTDDVIANHTIDITSGDSCYNLTISGSGIVRNLTGANRTLVVMGSLVNNGTIQISTFNLYLRIVGNITNNGTWTSVTIRFIGSSPQYISQAAGKDFNGNGKLIEDLDSLSSVIIGSNVVLRNFEVDMDMGFLELPNAYTLSLLDGILKNANILGNMSALLLRNTAYIQDCNLINVHLKGQFIIASGVTGVGEIIVDDTLQNYAGASRWFNCTGNFTNNGYVSNGSSYVINFNFGGNVVNNGTWTCSQIQMTSASSQNIYCTGTKFITCIDFIDTNPASPVNLDGDLYLKNTQLDLNGSTMNCNGHYLTMRGTVTAGDGTFNKARLKGLFRPYDSNIIFTEWVEVCDTLQESSSNYYAVSIMGNLINNGTIRKNSGYGIRISLTGNFENNGYFSPNSLTFSGLADQIISSSSKSNMIQDMDMFDNNPSSALIILNDLTLINTAVDLAGSTVQLQGGNLIQSGSSIRNASIIGNGEFYFKQSATAYLDEVLLQNLHLKGSVRVYSINVVLNNVTIDDTLTDRNISSYKTVLLKGQIVNNGKVIESNAYGIRFNIEDTVINNGIWRCEVIDFKGSDQHFVETTGGNNFEIENMNATGTGNIVAGNELRFLNTTLSLSGRSLIIPATSHLYAVNSAFKSMTLAGDSSIAWFENSYFASMVVQKMVLTGTVDLEANVNFEIENDISDILQNRGISSWISFSSFENFFNNGSVRNRPAFSYKLDYYSYGNVFNNGSWKIRKNYWKGLVDQDIYLINNNNIGTESQFDAMITATAFQWYRNDTLMGGKTQSTLVFDSIMVSHRAFYQCKTDNGNSRIIRVCTPVGIALSEQLFICYGDSVQLLPVITSGSAPYTYEWTPSYGLSATNILNPYAKPFNTTTYKLKITDRIGCVGEVWITVEVNPEFSMTAGTDIDLCIGSGTTIGASVAGGTPGYSYLWTPATGLSNPLILNPIATPVTTTNYTLTITDLNGCQKTDQALVTVHPLPQIFSMTGGGEYCSGDPGILIGLTGSQSNVKYQLYRNGTPTGDIFAGTGNAISFGQFTISGTYSSKAVFNITNCEEIMNGSAVITLKDSPEFSLQPVSQVKFAGEDVSFTVTATGTPPLFYHWFKDGEELEDEQSNILEIIGLTLSDAGSYICQVNNDCGIVPSEAAQLTVLTKQIINIPAGWSGFSTYQQVYNPNVADMFSQVNSNLTLVQDQTHIYWPATGTNTYLAWNTEMGAQIKMNSPAALEIIGTPDSDGTFNLPSTWYYLPVLSSCNVAASAVFGPLGSNLKLVKDIAGSRIFWPEYGIQTLNTLEPGKAYFIKLNNPGSISFPDCGKSEPEMPDLNHEINNTPWNDPVYTPNSHVIILPIDVSVQILKPGDKIGIFNPEGFCSGLTTYNNENTGLIAFADDPSTEVKDGFSLNEPFTLKVYRPSTSETFNVSVNLDDSDNFQNLFNSNGISLIREFNLSGVDHTPVWYKDYKVYPNPASESVTITGINDFTTIKIINPFGQVLFEGNISHTIKLDVSGFTKGIYSVLFINDGQIYCHNLIIQ